jgi:hypothetical protein
MKGREQNQKTTPPLALPLETVARRAIREMRGRRRIFIRPTSATLCSLLPAPVQSPVGLALGIGCFPECGVWRSPAGPSSELRADRCCSHIVVFMSFWYIHTKSPYCIHQFFSGFWMTQD